MRPALLYGSEIVISKQYACWLSLINTFKPNCNLLKSMDKSTGSGTKPGSSMGDRDRPKSNQNRTKRGTGMAENGM